MMDYILQKSSNTQQKIAFELSDFESEESIVRNLIVINYGVSPNLQQPTKESEKILVPQNDGIE